MAVDQGYCHDHPDFTALAERCLAEDLGSGDITTRTTVPAASRARARLMAKSEFVFCGRSLAEAVVGLVDRSLKLTWKVEDAMRCESGDCLLEIEGSARSILVAERSVLNLAMRATAVATHARRFVDLAQQHAPNQGRRARVVDTRKTMPGLRALDRYAVRCGGAHNHRNDLGSGVLIKENHIRAAGSIEAAVAGAVAGASHGMRIECEVCDLDELARAVAAGADIVLLDNMSDADMRTAVRDYGDRVILEISGGVSLERMPSLASIGAHVISVGAITHSPPSVDMSLLFDLSPT